MDLLFAACPLVIAFILDCIMGDPYTLPHPIRLIGTMIAGGERWMRRIFPGRERLAGTLLAVLVLLAATAVPVVILMGCYHIHIWLGAAVESIFCYYMIAARCLRDESTKVYAAMEKQDIDAARAAVSMIVGRDTEPLDGTGIIKAAVETVAENTSDGVTAPMFYMMFGGAAAGFFYKAVNTMDSMIGYKNEKYRNFGTFAARLDDVLNYIPSRLTAVFMIISAVLLGMDGRQAAKIWRRDCRKHASPNSAQTEAACAGALNIQLAGDAWYFGRLCKKDTIGDHIRPVENEDIRRVDRLMYMSAILMLMLAVAVRILLFRRFYG